MIIKETTKQGNRLILILMMLFAIIGTSIMASSVSLFILQLLIAFINLPLIMKKSYKTAKIYIIISIVSMAFVFLVYLANQAYYGSPYYLGGSDDLKFEKQALEVLNAGILNPQKILDCELIGRFSDSTFYVIYISILYRFADLFDGFTTFIPRIMNVYFLLWITMIFEYLIRKYANFSDKKANISIAFFALCPNILYINSHVFRDTFNLLQIFLIVFILDKLLSKKVYIKKIAYLVAFFILIYVTYYTRKNSLVFAGALSLVIVGDRFRIKKRYIFIVLVPLIIASNFLDTIGLVKYMDYYSNYNASVVADGLSRYVYIQPLLPFGIFYRMFLAFISPFPNFFLLFKESSKFLYDFVRLLVNMGVLLQIIFAPFIVKRALKLDWLALTFLSVFIPVVITTFTFRHVIIYYAFLVALGVDGYLSSNRKVKVQTLFFSGISLLFLSSIYFVLKLFL